MELLGIEANDLAWWNAQCPTGPNRSTCTRHDNNNTQTADCPLPSEDTAQLGNDSDCSYSQKNRSAGLVGDWDQLFLLNM